MEYRYPPLNTLHTFLLASRTQSFTQAADSLCVTRSAVSRQIKNLENQLGIKLFERHKSQLELTPKGLEYADSLSSIFADLKIATDLARGNGEDLKLKLSLSATFNTTWLINKLPLLEQSHPDLALAFTTHSYDTGTEPCNFDSGSMDAAIRLGSGPEQWPGCQVDKLVDLQIQPLCAPDLISGQTLERLEYLADYNWLHYQHMPDLWQQWLADAGAPELTTRKKNIVLDNISVAAHAMASGLGILPVYRPLADHSLRDGRTIVAHNHQMTNPDSYYFVCPTNYSQHTGVDIFRDWIVAQAKVL